MTQNTENQNCISEDCPDTILMPKRSLLSSHKDELLFTICIRIPCILLALGSRFAIKVTRRAHARTHASNKLWYCLFSRCINLKEAWNIFLRLLGFSPNKADVKALMGLSSQSRKSFPSLYFWYEKVNKRGTIQWNLFYTT